MSTETVAMLMGASPEVAMAIENTCIRFNIITPLQKAHFIAQMYVESQGFKRFRENLNYSAKRLAEVWPNRYALNPRASVKDRMPNSLANRIGGNPRAIANLTYGGRMGNVDDDDGWKFIGRGGKQLTGRSNYTQYSLEVYGDLRCVAEPERLEKLPDAILSGGWFWNANGLNALAARDNVEAVTRKVNGGLNGLPERRLATAQAKALFEDLLHPLNEPVPMAATAPGDE